MTKVDKDNYKGKEKLPIEYNDAHAALRGFANSKLKSSLILSAGMNPRLYAYMSQFNDFYPNEYGQFNKKIILKTKNNTYSINIEPNSIIKNLKNTITKNNKLVFLIDRKVFYIFKKLKNYKNQNYEKEKSW